jgi:hypothetical protein
MGGLDLLIFHVEHNRQFTVTTKNDGWHGQVFLAMDKKKYMLKRALPLSKYT